MFVNGPFWVLRYCLYGGLLSWNLHPSHLCLLAVQSGDQGSVYVRIVLWYWRPVWNYWVPTFFRQICVYVWRRHQSLFKKRFHIVPTLHPLVSSPSPHIIFVWFVHVYVTYTPKSPVFFSLNTNYFEKKIFHIVPTFFSSDLCMCMWGIHQKSPVFFSKYKLFSKRDISYTCCPNIADFGSLRYMQGWLGGEMACLFLWKWRYTV